MAMNKKGIFYVYISAIFIMIFIVVFLAYKQYSYLDRQKVVETRILTVDDFVKDLEFDSERVMYVSGFRSLIALEDYVAKRGVYLNNSEELFKIAFFNGTINGTVVEVLKNSTYTDYLNKLEVLAAGIGIDVNINVTGIELYQDSPWSVRVIVITHVNITDTKGLARWDYDHNFTTAVSLVNIRDPIYSVSTFGKVLNTIRADNATQFVTNTTDALSYHVNSSLYIANPDAPSFLMRLEGNFSSSPYGIESLVYTPELLIQGIAFDEDKSIVDFVLFTNITGYSQVACEIDDMPEWFKIDLNHTSAYEINELNYTVC